MTRDEAKSPAFSASIMSAETLIPRTAQIFISVSIVGEFWFNSSKLM